MTPADPGAVSIHPFHMVIDARLFLIDVHAYYKFMEREILGEETLSKFAAGDPRVMV